MNPGPLAGSLAGAAGRAGRRVARAALLLLGVFVLLKAAAASTLAPSDLVVQAPPAPEGCTTLHLAWKPVPGAFGYEVFQFRGGRWWLGDDEPSRVPMTASTAISGLEPGSPYEFRVRALGPDGPSEMSEPAGGRTLPEGGSPEPRPSTGSPRPSTGSPRPSTGSPRPSTGSPRPSTGSPRQERATAGVDSPPPPAPSGVIGVFSDSDSVQLNWRAVEGAACYRVEEEKEGRWGEVEGPAGRPQENRVRLVGHPRPGPFRFRVFAVGANGRMSEPSLVITVDRDW